MSKGEIHKGDVGTPFEMQIKNQSGAIVDVSTADVKLLIFKKPDGTTVTKDAVFSSDGKDGKIRYISETDFLDSLGHWQWQAYIEMPSGKWHSDLRDFEVFDNL